MLSRLLATAEVLGGGLIFAYVAVELRGGAVVGPPRDLFDDRDAPDTHTICHIYTHTHCHKSRSPSVIPFLSLQLSVPAPSSQAAVLVVLGVVI